jgi:hypothetical protein
MKLITKSKTNYIVNIMLNNNIVLRMRRRSLREAERLADFWMTDPKPERLPLLCRV